MSHKCPLCDGSGKLPYEITKKLDKLQFDFSDEDAVVEYLRPHVEKDSKGVFVIFDDRTEMVEEDQPCPACDGEGSLDKSDFDMWNKYLAWSYQEGIEQRKDIKREKERLAKMPVFSMEYEADWNYVNNMSYGGQYDAKKRFMFDKLVRAFRDDSFLDRLKDANADVLEDMLHLLHKAVG